MALLEVRDLVKVHDGAGRPAVDGVSLDIAGGEVVAVMGPSGSGKTTLLNLVGLLDTPTSGTVRIDGADVDGLDDRARTDLRQRRLGFVFQHFNLVPVLTALENVALPLVLGGVPRAEREGRAADTLEQVGVGALRDRLPQSLSGGEQQRVAIARALVHEPDLVLADEPTGNLDSATGTAIIELLTSLARSPTRAVIVVTHDAAVADRADRTVRLVDGRLAT